MKDDEALDRAIDQVARELAQGTPPRGFAGRVRERIDRPRRTRAWAWQMAGGLALIALVAYVGWPEKRMPVPGPVDRVVTARPAPQPSAIVESREAMAALPPVRRTAAALPRRTRVVPRIPIDVDAPQIAALRDIADLAVVVNAPASLALTEIEVPELAVAPLDPDHDHKEPR